MGIDKTLVVIYQWAESMLCFEEGFL